MKLALQGKQCYDNLNKTFSTIFITIIHCSLPHLELKQTIYLALVFSWLYIASCYCCTQDGRLQSCFIYMTDKLYWRIHIKGRQVSFVPFSCVFFGAIAGNKEAKKSNNAPSNTNYQTSLVNSAQSRLISSALTAPSITIRITTTITTTITINKINQRIQRLE